MTDFLVWWADHWPLIPALILIAPTIARDWYALWRGASDWYWVNGPLIVRKRRLEP